MATERRLGRPAASVAALGAVVAVASSVVPLSYDEGNWLAVTRRVAAGETLYRGITDNKSPALFGLVRALDVLPGPYPIARAIFLGVATALLAWLSIRLARRLGLGDPAATLLGLCVGLTGALQAVLVANFEFPAILLLVAGLSSVAGGSDVAGGVIGGLAATFDLRAAPLALGLVALGYETGGRRSALRVAAAAAVPLVAWGATVLISSDLRYSLLELNVATRGGGAAWHPARQLAAFARSMVFPLAAFGLLTAGPSRSRRTIPVSGGILLALGLAAAVVSVQPFDKYWTLTIPGLLVVAGYRRPRENPLGLRWTAAILCLALVPHALYAATSSADQARIVRRYEDASHVVAATLGPGHRFVRFTSEPFLGTFLPAEDATPAAVLDFLIAPTSREPVNLALVDRAISHAAAIIDDGALSVATDSILPAYRPLHRIFASHLAEFPCLKKIAGLTIRMRPERCR